MSDRAPDGQPTENIRLCLKTEQDRLAYWRQCKAIEERALARSIESIDRGEEQVRRWERYLNIRLAEEAATVEVTGL